MVRGGGRVHETIASESKRQGLGAYERHTLSPGDSLGDEASSGWDIKGLACRKADAACPVVQFCIPVFPISCLLKNPEVLVEASNP
jgi:hypothetical protein